LIYSEAPQQEKINKDKNERVKMKRYIDGARHDDMTNSSTQTGVYNPITN